MKDKHLYIIAGCNGAGKTTASFNILPVLLNYPEKFNAIKRISNEQ
jgi:predicted ABC-type ATPase